MALIDYTSPIGSLLSMVNNMTGSLFLSLLFLCLIIMFMFIGLNLPIELSLIIIIPFLLIVVIATSQLWIVLGVVLIMLCIFLAKNWFM